MAVPRHARPLALLLIMLLAAAPAVRADELDDAESLLARGERAGAREALDAWMETDGADAAGLLRAAQAARRLQDLDLLGKVRAAGEALEQQAASPDLDLALGFAYLGLAEANLRLQTGSRSISLYFADAIARADKVPAEAPHGETAARLATAARYAQGDLAGAIAKAAAYRKAQPEVSARFEALAGRLYYERGAAQPVAASGHASDAARADLEQAIAALATAASAVTLPQDVRTGSRLRLAWAQHRLGRVDAALASYVAVYGPGRGTRNGTLVLRGLASLLARQPQKHGEVLEALAQGDTGDTAPLDDLVTLHLGRKAYKQALHAAHRRLEASGDDADGWWRLGDVLLAMGQIRSATRHFAGALERSPGHLAAAGGMERAARAALAARNVEHAVTIYRRLMALRPQDPYCRNNLGFILRDVVTPYTTMARGSLQKLKPGAPPRVRELLDLCVSVYAEAAALIDPALDGTRDELVAWNLAGIVNDYGLMLHYFVDVQDAELAERQYLRALRMTDHSFKDTYSPNLQRLYGLVLRDRDWAWYRAAREARDAILAEARDAEGRLTLVPDAGKRAAAQRDMDAARARIVQALAEDASDDGIPWPPRKENGNDR